MWSESRESLSLLSWSYLIPISNTTYVRSNNNELYYPPTHPHVEQIKKIDGLLSDYLQKQGHKPLFSCGVGGWGGGGYQT